MRFDFDLIREAGVLTGLGMGTAFGLLLLLMIFTWVMGSVTVKLQDIRHDNAVPTSAELDEDRRAKATAAVVAVTAVLTRLRQSDDAT